MVKGRQYPAELRERAVRLVEESVRDGRGEWATMRSVAGKPGIGAPETVRKWVEHAQFTVETGLPVFFADPHSPWQRGTNENTNGLLRRYFPKGTDLVRWGADDLPAVATALNSRPRKTLGWKAPAEALDDHLRSLQNAGVSTTG